MKLHDIQQEIIKLANEHPDQTAKCEYFNMQGDPVCIVGHAMSRLGASADVFRSISINSAAFRASRVLDAAGVEDGDIHIIEWIDTVQAVQDEGETWSEAVALANDYEDDTSLSEKGGVNADLC